MTYNVFGGIVNLTQLNFNSIRYSSGVPSSKTSNGDPALSMPVGRLAKEARPSLALTSLCRRSSLRYQQRYGRMACFEFFS